MLPRLIPTLAAALLCCCSASAQTTNTPTVRSNIAPPLVTTNSPGGGEVRTSTVPVLITGYVMVSNQTGRVISPSTFWSANADEIAAVAPGGTNQSAASLTSGTLDDARLSSNVLLRTNVGGVSGLLALPYDEAGETGLAFLGESGSTNLQIAYDDGGGVKLNSLTLGGETRSTWPTGGTNASDLTAGTLSAARLPHRLTPEMFGGTPNDGLNDAPAFTSLVSAVTNNSWIDLGSGRWLIDRDVFIVANRTNLTITGAGAWLESTNNSAANSVLRITNCADVTIQGIAFTTHNSANTVTNYTTCIDLRNSPRVRVRGCSSMDVYRFIDVLGSPDCLVTECSGVGAGQWSAAAESARTIDGIWVGINDTCGTSDSRNFVMSGCSVTNTYDLVYANWSTGLRVENCTAYGTHDSSIYLCGSNLTVKGCSVFNAGKDAIKFWPVGAGTTNGGFWTCVGNLVAWPGRLKTDGGVGILAGLPNGTISGNTISLDQSNAVSTTEVALSCVASNLSIVGNTVRGRGVGSPSQYGVYGSSYVARNVVVSGNNFSKIQLGVLLSSATDRIRGWTILGNQWVDGTRAIQVGSVSPGVADLVIAGGNLFQNVGQALYLQKATNVVVNGNMFADITGAFAIGVYDGVTNLNVEGNFATRCPGGYWLREMDAAHGLVTIANNWVSAIAVPYSFTVNAAFGHALSNRWDMPSWFGTIAATQANLSSVTLGGETRSTWPTGGTGSVSSAEVLAIARTNTLPTGNLTGPAAATNLTTTNLAVYFFGDSTAMESFTNAVLTGSFFSGRVAYSAGYAINGTELATTNAGGMGAWSQYTNLARADALARVAAGQRVIAVIRAGANDGQRTPSDWLANAYGFCTNLTADGVQPVICTPPARWFSNGNEGWLDPGGAQDVWMQQKADGLRRQNPRAWWALADIAAYMYNPFDTRYYFDGVHNSAYGYLEAGRVVNDACLNAGKLVWPNHLALEGSFSRGVFMPEGNARTNIYRWKVGAFQLLNSGQTNVAYVDWDYRTNILRRSGNKGSVIYALDDGSMWIKTNHTSAQQLDSNGWLQVTAVSNLCIYGIGDSLMGGSGEGAGVFWAALMTNSYFVGKVATNANHAVGGMGLWEGTDCAWEQWTNHVQVKVAAALAAGFKPIVIVNIGANDAEHAPAVWNPQYLAFITALKNSGAFVVCCTVTPHASSADEVPGAWADVWREEKNDYIRRMTLADNSRWGACVDFAAYLNNPFDTNFFLTDKVHQNAAGEREKARMVNAVMLSGAPNFIPGDNGVWHSAWQIGVKQPSGNESTNTSAAYGGFAFVRNFTNLASFTAGSDTNQTANAGSLRLDLNGLAPWVRLASGEWVRLSTSSATGGVSEAEVRALLISGPPVNLTASTNATLDIFTPAALAALQALAAQPTTNASLLTTGTLSLDRLSNIGTQQMSAAAHALYIAGGSTGGVSSAEVLAIVSTTGHTFTASQTFSNGVIIAGALDLYGTLTADLFSGPGYGLTSLQSSNLAGTISDARLSANVPLKNAGTNTFTGSQEIGGDVWITGSLDVDGVDASGSITTSDVIYGNASGTSNTPASTLTGTLADARLSSNVPLLNNSTNTFTGRLQAQRLGATNNTTLHSAVLASGATGLFTVSSNGLVTIQGGTNENALTVSDYNGAVGFAACRNSTTAFMRAGAAGSGLKPVAVLSQSTWTGLEFDNSVNFAVTAAASTNVGTLTGTVGLVVRGNGRVNIGATTDPGVALGVNGEIKIVNPTGTPADTNNPVTWISITNNGTRYFLPAYQ